MAIENFNQEEKYELIMINGKIYLSNSIRLRRDSVPEGIHVYSVRESDEGMDLASIHYNVIVNHSMDILCLEEPEGIENGIEIEDWCMLNFDVMTLNEFKTFMQESGSRLEG
ncbi:LPD28 domain-containing protein [Listeria seeligeri]|uniref:LPD28 domain-containing protein n=1 Tax=Listeria seeligeri TaxID=1640 RepID=UPI0022EBC892|nr:LPD28 domain-containing protein [Listeria seeligeri]